MPNYNNGPLNYYNGPFMPNYNFLARTGPWPVI